MFFSAYEKEWQVQINVAIKKMKGMIFFSLATLPFKNISNIASLLPFLGNNIHNARNISVVMTLSIAQVDVRGIYLAVVCDRKIGSMIGLMWQGLLLIELLPVSGSGIRGRAKTVQVLALP